ncbi:hypothetical protein GNY06_02740 [Elizabethkingia argentiflava]|uniref:Fibrobacter succinogenes major paralogous domain-containing protein n=1 Tax=Elizabethkingia argenteiflava TaxID=2681556 RepID=A0A845PW66_9FLAO|nr:FISUMP domain-containing protein [Elizabethkingia argenteiflava]NAW50350.1 hypothetical protein [Elizabethkingia argenteiflava]
MKKKESKINPIILLRSVLVIVLFWGISCRSTHSSSEEVATGNTIVRISLQGSSFEGDRKIGPSASNHKLNTDVSVQRQEFFFKEDDAYKLVATLTPETPKINSFENTAVAEKRVSSLGQGIRYKVLVYDHAGNYVKEQNYVSGEASPEITGLAEGGTYDFVVYSIGSTSQLPEVTYTDPSKKTLSTAGLEGVSGDSDLMYFSKKLTVTADKTNVLDIVFRHKFSQIITTLDASPTHYSILDIKGVMIPNHSDRANIKLSNGETSPAGSKIGRELSFPKLNAESVIASPVFFNGGADYNGFLSIKSVKMSTSGGLKAYITHENIRFNRLVIEQGIRYNLKLSFEPNDKYLEYRGYPAARINGFIFMRHNLGAQISANPDVPSVNIVGNYYQWGRSKAVAQASTPPGPIQGWDNTTNTPSSNAWNPRPEEEPAKTSTDPCPAGWRVPSGREFIALESNTTRTVIGSNQNSPINFSGAAVLTSKYNTSVKLTFMSAGYRNSTDGSLLDRGGSRNYWNSVAHGDLNAWTASINNFNHYNKNIGATIRCVAENPLQ